MEIIPQFFNTDVFTRFQLADSEEVIKADEAHVEELAKMLVDSVIPSLVHDVSVR